MDTNKIYDEFYELLKSPDEIPADNRLFTILENYAKARMHDLIGTDEPLHFYYKKESQYSVKNTVIIKKDRVNPLTGESCKRKWDRDLRAFHCEEGIYADFDITNKLEGYTKCFNLIDFAFTIEHELKHSKQLHDLSSGVVSYDNYRMAKDVILIEYDTEKNPDSIPVFYKNGHDYFFLEMDANNQARKFVGDQITKRGLGKIKICSFGDKTYDVDSIFQKREFESHTNAPKTHYTLDMIFGPDNQSYMTLLHDNPEKITNLIIDNLLKQNPEKYIKKQPILAMVYNEDGTKKTYQEIEEIINYYHSKQMIDFYEQVIENDPLLKIQKIESEMINKYFKSKDIEEKKAVLDEGLDIIKTIIKNENIDLNNLLIYLDKRIEQIDRNSNDERKNTSKLIFSLARQAILTKSILKNGYNKVSSYKEEILECQKILRDNCDINFAESDKEKVADDIRKLINILEHDFLNEIYSKKGYSKEEIKELVFVAQKYQRLISPTGYILYDEEKEMNNDKANGILPGPDNLYQTHYYRDIILANNDIKERTIQKQKFEMLNLMYIEAQKDIGSTGEDLRESGIVFLRENPVISKCINENPGLMEMLYEIRENEDDISYMTKLDGLILQCEKYLDKGQKARKV